MRRGIATFTLDYGRCPPWLFRRMVALGREMMRVLIEEYGPDEIVRRLADPVWFQSLGTVLAFDWNASGLTTILTAALKEAIRQREQEWGIFICGGKGKTSRRTPEEIAVWGGQLGFTPEQTNWLIYNSKMSAKVDSALVQDGFQIYHHSFIFSRNGAWAVVQQGMNAEAQAARRYHWFSEKATDLVCEPHAAIVSDSGVQLTLDMTARLSGQTRETSVALVDGGYRSLMNDIQVLRRHSSRLSQMIAVRRAGGIFETDSDSDGTPELTLLNLENVEFRSHPVVGEDFSKSRYLEKILGRICSEKPAGYEQLVASAGVGPKTVRALALVAEVIYGAAPSYEDPARFSFAHGGKDATPYPVDRAAYDQTIEMLRRAVVRTRLESREKNQALQRLYKSVI